MLDHTVELLSLCVALRLPHVAHLYCGGAVGLVLTVLLAPPVHLRFPEHLGGGAATLRYAGGYQGLVPAVQQSRGAGGYIHLWLHCVKGSGEEMRQRKEKGKGGEGIIEWRK